MSKTNKNVDTKDHLADISAKLSLLLAIAVRTNPAALEENKSLANVDSVGFLATLGISDEDIATILSTTKGSAERARQRFAKKRK